MLRFIVRRILQAIPIFIGITAIVFALANLAPGSPADVVAAAGNLPEAAYEELKTALGLDKPLPVRYALWLGRLLHGDLGFSSNAHRQVWDLIGQRIGPSLLLAGTAILLALTVGVALGVMAAYRPYSRWDNISSALSFIGVSTPNFFLSLLLIYIFAVRLGLLPAQGMYYTGHKSLSGLLLHLLMPASVLGLQMVGNFVKQTRNSMLTALNEEYIKTARAKGLGEAAVVLRHALRNAWIPVVATLGMTVPTLVGGAVVTEQIFGWPGIGSLMVHSINTRDYNTIMGITVLVSLGVLAVNIVLDAVYSLLDPRIKV
ncbi:MAG: ABC transporter permease [Gracilibacteraceae bacterium]|jgi:peptide/nickel transport system permease protein|nr:ABC transporter permease [Gracilibacteraceae bacterium]